MSDIKKGLEGVEVLETRISFIDGDEGVLEYRGHDINDLAKLDYEVVSHLLLFGHLPDERELTAYTQDIRAVRPVYNVILRTIRTCNFNIEAMEALRTAVSYQSHCDLDLKNMWRDANIRKAIRLIAKFPTIVAAFSRIHNGLPTVAPDPQLSHGANFLHMLRGEMPTDLEAEIMETDFILSAEHELNASTFSARVTASTLSDMHSAIISGLNTLNGPLHGGARMAVMDYMAELGTPEEAEEYVLTLIANKKKVMGFGHRVYKTYDPRALIYKDLARRIAAEHPDKNYLAVAEAVEATVMREFVEKKGKPIYPNVDFYSAVVYMYMDLHPRLATALFAIARISGWAAHILEQYSDNRLIRPRAKAIRQQ
ncbi:MAG: citrate/2-methylcitrate synthase [Thermoplasmata archaeon]|nr:citrate/2-methylcitrate synthase [Thermoplasmata archaeon]